MNKVQSRIFDALIEAGQSVANSRRVIGYDKVREDILDSLIEAASLSVICPVCEVNGFNYCLVGNKQTGEIKRYLPDKPHRMRVRMLREFGIELGVTENK